MERTHGARRVPAKSVGNPLYRARRTLHTVEDLLTNRQRERLRVRDCCSDRLTCPRVGFQSWW